MKKKLFLLKLIPENTAIRFVEASKISFVISAILLILSCYSLLHNGINFGIDFKGGLLIEAQFKKQPDITSINNIISRYVEGEIKIQDFTDNNVMIKIADNNGKISQTVSKIKKALVKIYADGIEFRKIDYVGPQVSQDLIDNSLIAVVVSFLIILAYVAIRFKLQCGIGIILAIIHDIILTFGFISVVQLEFDIATIASILTIIGYSVNDSVVIYDRIRENSSSKHGNDIKKLINKSINQTLSRTILTVLTTLVAVFALMVFGGNALFNFSAIIFIGIIIGTYSSIFIAAPMLKYFNIKQF